MPMDLLLKTRDNFRERERRREQSMFTDELSSVHERFVSSCRITGPSDSLDDRLICSLIEMSITEDRVNTRLDRFARWTDAAFYLDSQSGRRFLRRDHSTRAHVMNGWNLR